MEDEYESDFDTVTSTNRSPSTRTTPTTITSPSQASTTRTSFLRTPPSNRSSVLQTPPTNRSSSFQSYPTKSITLPYGSTHHCFTRSNRDLFSSNTRTSAPSSASSFNPGQKYLRSSFPNLIGTLGKHTKPQNNEQQKRTSKNVKNKSLDEETEDEEREEPQKKLSFGEEIRRRNEYQWSRIEDVVKDTMVKYDDYCKNLVIKNELQLKENHERNQKQISQLEKIEKKKKDEQIKKSSYARIWNHHAKMRELAEQLYQEKVEKEKRRKESKKKDKSQKWED